MGWIPMEAALARAAAQQTTNAGGSLHLYTDSLTPTDATVKADFVAAEADFDDYTPQTVTAWYSPILSALGGYQITMPSQQFSQGSSTPVTPNIIRGYYYLSAGGDLLYAGRFPEDIPIATANAGIDVEVIDVFTTGFTGF